MPAKQSARPPFKVGDQVHGTSYVAPDRVHCERPEPFVGTVVQVGAGYAGVDRERAYLWVCLADGTECRALIRDTALVEPTAGAS
ncbi:MAG: hypothetical protein JO362_07995 [Streptomycetaceae bacterium]|nr:hypothetical protein [Streptomycetaceae bacterium]